MTGSEFGLKRTRIAMTFIGLALLSACDIPDGMADVDASIAVEPALESADAMMEPMVVPDMGAPRPERSARRGVVTAGDIDDALNLSAFKKYQSRTAKELDLPRANLLTPIQVQMVGPNGKPAPGVSYSLRASGASDAFHTGYSGVDGRITVFPASLGAGRQHKVELRAFDDGQEVTRQVISAGGWSKVAVPKASGWQPDFLDLVFVFDTTGSMGDELDWLTKEFAGIVRQARRSAPGVSIRYGLVAYRDQGDAYEVQNYGFTDQQRQMQSWLKRLNADGGGDYPEAADKAMQAAVNLDWRRGKGERIIFHIADAPPHKQNALSYIRAAQIAAGQDVQIFGLGASGVGAESEYLMRQASVLSGGRYLFLTDDSGVGNSHAEPNIACYRVTKLKDLLIRVLQSELSGTRREAAPSAVIREVGNYKSGVCAQ
ncbi:vWA domain-containing protein [uncultured Pelagimonas sp.]|uniref:vWA domain-containing protein n=1 Tax=uncultured Pelagimonas sp. TaxID=1618102 RepID=UPI002609E470|nr:vWA domain-containing protein [uncultured Pelagimonas sp.]